LFVSFTDNLELRALLYEEGQPQVIPWWHQLSGPILGLCCGQ